MRALRSFTVRPSLPEPLAALHDLAMNLRWSWDERTRDIFRWVDPDAWEITGHDPVGLLGQVSRARLDELANDSAFLAFLAEGDGELQRYLSSPRWFQSRPTSPLRSIAYFSPEFGIAEALPQYSGGLGVLAGDHLKAASGLGVPLVGVGLFYRQGYFRQELDADGWQQERYADLDPYAMALSPVDGVRVEVSLAGTPAQAQVWRADVGRVRLYGGATEHRIRQEILLGVGGVRALEAVGENPHVFHTNEGHAGFLGLERIRRAMLDDKCTLVEAIESVRAGTVFTTHTPVPAGIDRFPRELMERYFEGWADEVGVSFDDLMGIGHEDGDAPDAPFNMAVMGLRLAGRSNGVSKLHGQVSRQMFEGLWPGVPTDEVPIGSVTNGVHAHTWVSPEMNDLLDRYVLPEWQDAGEDRWRRVLDARDDEVWRVREQSRERMIGYVRRRLRASELSRGLSESDVEWTEEALNPRVLTIGFARRFASYKRATLLLSQPERLKALLLDADRPVQLIFAGKAHPADDIGKQMIKEIYTFARQPDIRHRMAFVEDYDIALARELYQGSDVWLNNPRRPQEACGTSGEKAALSGALNCSILDGWWDEMFDGENGWAISSAESYEDLARRDEVEAASLFSLLERQIVPLFYDHGDGGVPRRWVGRIRSSLSSLGWQISASRMVRDYVEQLYEPTAARADALTADNHRKARDLAAWKERVRSGWAKVAVGEITSDGDPAELGATRRVETVVDLGPLQPEDVAVQLLHGPVGTNGELQPSSVVTMAPDGAAAKTGATTYAGTFTCDRAGRYGFTVRVVPFHDDLTSPAELGCVTGP
jgi:starch phosphorylase